MKRRLLILMIASCAVAYAQTTSTITGVIKDLSQAVVPTGKVTFELVPGLDATISGLARFTNSLVTCSINQVAVGTSQAVRAANVVTISGLSGHTYIVNDVVTISGMADSSFNGTFTLTGTTASTITYSQTAANLTSGSGVVSALRGGAPNGTTAGSCTLTYNTALNPPGTSYRATLYPNGVKTAQFGFYAYQASIDISTVIPTPAGLPTYSFVDTFTNQTINGNKTFSGTTALGQVNVGGAAIFGSTATFGGTTTVNGALASTVSFTANNAAINGPLTGVTSITSGNGSPALTGFLRMSSGDQHCWRLALTANDGCFYKNANDIFILGNEQRYSIQGALQPQAIFRVMGTNDPTSTIANQNTEFGWQAASGAGMLANEIFQVGQIVEIHGSGVFSTTGTPTLRVRIRPNAFVGGIALDFGPVTTPNNAAGVGVDFVATCLFTAVGVSGSMDCDGVLTMGAGTLGSPAVVVSAPNTTSTIDTTAAQIWESTVQWSAASASNTIAGKFFYTARKN